MAEVVHLNTNLEAQVKARTETLLQREQALRLVLDSIGDGLFEVGRDGRLTGACSAAAVRWFGTPEPGASLANYLFPANAEQAACFSVAFDQLTEDFLPWELCLDQMPKRLERESLVLELEFKRVLEAGEFTKVLVVSRNISEAIESERAERNAREQQTLIGKLLQDKAGFAQFVKDCEGLLSSLSSTHDMTLAKRDLHTLKGNVGLFGLTSVAEFCHALEDRMAATEALPSGGEVADLARLWRLRLQSIETFLTQLSDSRLEVEMADHSRLIHSLLERQDYNEIISMVELWSWTRTAERLTRLRAYAEHLATRLGKSIQVRVEHNDLRVPRDYLETFWTTVVHVVRNAVDHGAEPTAVRVAHGKAAETSVVLSTTQTDRSLVIEVRDDGPGVDRAALLRCARAIRKDLPDDTTTEELMFLDGVSARSEVSETSGRGVGLSAVKYACEADGGSVEVLSTLGQGTTFRFRFQRPVVKPGALAERLERRWSLRPKLSGQPATANTNAREPARNKTANDS
jgi:two-component system chemotaxis sensor kinase CheA